MFMRVTGLKLYLPVKILRFDYDQKQVIATFHERCPSLFFSFDHLVTIQFPIHI